MKYLKISLFLSVCILTIVSCANNSLSGDEPGYDKKQVIGPDLYDSTTVENPISIVGIYLVTQLNGKDIAMNKDTQKNITIELQSENNRMMGFAGCNNFTGEYTYDNGVFHAINVGSTKKMCPEGMDLENEFINSLNTANSVKSIDRGLALYNNEKLLMNLKKIDE